MKNLTKYQKILCHRITAFLLAFIMIAAGVFGTGVTVNAEGAGDPEGTEFFYAYDVQRSPSYPKKGTQSQPVIWLGLYVQVEMTGLIAMDPGH